MALTKVSGGILDPGINVAGIVTATGFDGPFVGGTGDSINAGIITATGLDVNGNGDISGSLTVGSGGLDLNGSGDISGDLVIHGNLTANGDFTTLNTTLREVEILRVDANTTAVAGIITQRGSGNILSLYDGVAELFTVADGGNVTIKNITGTPNFNIQGTNANATAQSNINFLLRDGNSADRTIAQLIARNTGNGGYGALDFYTAFNNTNIKRMSISSGGDVTVESGSFAVTDPSEKIGIGLANPVKPLHIYTAGADSEIRLQTNSGTEQNSYISLRHATGDLDLFTVQAGTKMKFYTANAERLQITGTGQFHMGGTPGWTYASQKFVVVEPSNPLGMILQGNNANQGVNLTLQNISNTVNAYSDISFADDGGQIFGAIRGKVVDRDNNHGEIQFHTSSGSLGQQVTIDKDGNVIIGTSTWQYKKPLNVQGESGSILSLYNGDTTSYAANTYSAIELKILTGNTGNTFGALEIRGIKEEGTNGNNARALTFYTGLNGGSNAERLRIASDGVLKIERGSASDTALEINTTSTSNACRIKFNESGSNKAQIAYSHDNDRLELVSQSGNGIAIYSGGNLVWNFDTNGHLLPNTAGAVDIGSASAEIGNVYIADSKGAQFGNSQELDIRHQGTTGYIQHSGSGYLFIHGNDIALRTQGQKNYIVCDSGNSVDLYFDAANHTTPKLKTSATGIIVEGEVAASQDYPNFRPALDFNFAATKKLDPRLEYQRTGPASFVNEFGNIVLVGDNTPRFDHDPVTRESKGILIEEQRSNDVANSQNVGGYSGGYMTGGTFTYPDDVVAPDGSTEGVLKMVSDTSTGYHGVQYTISGFGSNQNWAYQVWVKALPGSSINQITLYDNAQSGNTNNGSLVMNTTTGVFSFNGNNAESVAYNNGWYQIKIKGTRATTNAQSAMLLVLYNGSSNSYAGDGSSGFYVWGGQYENNTHHWTSFIPTYGTTATRGRDELTMSGSDLTDVFNNEEGTMFYEASLGDLTNDNQPIVAFRDLGTTSANYHAMGFAIGGSNPSIRTWFKTASNNEHLSAHTSTGLTANMFYKHIYGYKDADCADAYRTPTNSGILSNQSGNGSPMIAAGVVDELRFGGYYAYESQPVTYGLDAGHIKRFSYWPQKLTNAQLTTYIS